MSLSPKKNLPWWREPMVWLIIGLPVTAVIASLITLNIAVRNADSLVKEGYAKEGFTVQEVLEQDKEAVRRGLSANLTAEGVNLTLQLSGNTQSAASLNLILAHPTEARMDFSVMLTRQADGSYQAVLPELPTNGKRHLLLEAPDQTWRLHGSWDAPLAGQISLVAIGTGS